jgi:hypothetical protein
VGRPAQRTQGSVPENQFCRPHPDLHGGRLTEILEPLPEPRETSTAPAREEEHRAVGSPSTRPRWTECTAPHRYPAQQQRGTPYTTKHSATSRSNREDEVLHTTAATAQPAMAAAIGSTSRERKDGAASLTVRCREGESVHLLRSRPPGGCAHRGRHGSRREPNRSALAASASSSRCQPYSCMPYLPPTARAQLLP